jgi:hypothetical protein
MKEELQSKEKVKKKFYSPLLELAWSWTQPMQ